MTTQEAIGQTRTIVSAVERALDQAMTQARGLTQGGQGIDDHQVHCERLAYRATELQAAQALLRYAEMQGQHGHDDGVTGHMALAYAAEVHQTLLAEVGAHLTTYGIDEADVAPRSSAADVRQAARAGASEAFVCGIGQVVLDTNGVNAIWLGDEMAEMTRQSVRDFTRQEVEPLAEWVHRHDELAPDDLIAKMGELGFFAMSIPEAYGGTGMGMLVMVITTEELSRGSLGAAGSLITRPEIVAEPCSMVAQRAQKQRWLPRIASGELMVAVSVTEPDTGSDVASLTCRAEAAEVEGQRGYLINGAKAWCTFAGRADLIGLLARTDADGSRGARGLSLFILEKERFYGHDFLIQQPHGGTLRAKADATPGYRGMHSFTMHYEQFFLPADCLIGEEQGRNRGFYLQMRGFANGRLQTGGRALRPQPGGARKDRGLRENPPAVWTSDWRVPAHAVQTGAHGHASGRGTPVDLRCSADHGPGARYGARSSDGQAAGERCGGVAHPGRPVAARWLGLCGRNAHLALRGRCAGAADF